ncbi:Alpha/Beta hydrolase protein [Ampelomyces quisqualis]|uniref:Alpha/Beta hydrolase protein n=1 Tax=Ampelomyces quisqualis TaxID=50730 RepID=A0A6A5QJ62_AMPQU|nr:Alpha/Beta hydrolase protein [Ampelomyces quisqualis]
MALHIPFLSRLHVREYVALVLSMVLIGLESLLAVITLALPTPVITLCYRVTRRLWNQLASPSAKHSRQQSKGAWTAIANASDFAELCELYGYYCEEHIVQTGDGYLLGLHRLAWPPGDEATRVNGGPGGGGVSKKVVYLHHGLMMNSEVWVCLTERERCLPFELVERGYDVWLGNNRGNKYSKKSVHTAPTASRFWNFSMDQFAFHDIPDSIAYILATAHQPSLSYVGFSQGTAQAFATLSIHPTLNDKVDVFIALAPAMAPAGVASGVVDSFVKASPDILYLAFGRKSILPSATMWQSILYPPIFVRLIDASLRFLFGWSALNIAPHQKLAAYPHLYSFTSTKSVVHWFQIIRNGVFQMYDDEAPNPITSNRSKYYKVAKFPTKNIKTPIVLVYGGSDSLVDINVMLRELPRHTIAKEIPHYEHLDFLWAQSVNELVFPHVFEALEEHAGADGNKTKRDRWRSPAGYRGLLPDTDGASDPHCDEGGDESSSSPSALRVKKVSQNTRRSQYTDGAPADTTSNLVPQPPRASRLPQPKPSTPNATDHRRQSSQSPAPRPKIVLRSPTSTAESPAPSLDASQLTVQTSTSRPEGWWSSDEVGGTEQSRPTTPKTPIHNANHSPSRASFDSTRSSASKVGTGRFGDKGISLGVAKAISGLVGGEGHGEASGLKSDGEKALEASAEDKKRRKKAGRKKAAV